MNTTTNPALDTMRRMIAAQPTPAIVEMLRATDGNDPENRLVEMLLMDALCERDARLIAALDELEENWQTDARTVRECILDTLEADA